MLETWIKTGQFPPLDSPLNVTVLQLNLQAGAAHKYVGMWRAAELHAAQSAAHPWVPTTGNAVDQSRYGPTSLILGPKKTPRCRPLVGFVGTDRKLKPYAKGGCTRVVIVTRVTMYPANHFNEQVLVTPMIGELSRASHSSQHARVTDATRYAAFPHSRDYMREAIGWIKFDHLGVGQDQPV